MRPIWLVLTGCGGGPSATPTMVERLSPTEHLVRASMAVRGVRPSLDELQAVDEDPGALKGLVQGWLAGEAFGDTVEDWHAELYLLRDDTNYQLPVVGLLADRGLDQADVYRSTTEAPLRLVREVVLQDRPYTEILTADYTVADRIVADVYGLPFDEGGPQWQPTHWVDGRPRAGLLSDSQLWRRHTSNAANYHRGRANFVSRTWLCEDLGDRDVFVEGGVDVSDPDAVAEAVSTREACVACHDALDPLAAYFWGFKEQIQRNAVLQAYDLGCEWDWSLGEPPLGAYRPEHWCYPLKFWDVAEADGWADHHLHPPAFFGDPGIDLVDLGQQITADPRFATCTARTFAGWLTQRDRDELPEDWIAGLAEGLVASGWSARQLVEAVVLSDAFATRRVIAGDEPSPFAVGLQTLRPEQASRTLRDLTGFRFLADQDLPGCEADGNDCWGPVDLLDSDLYGFRAMMGGVDAYTVTHPTHTPTPTGLLALRTVARQAAGHVVDTDLAAPVAERHLLLRVEAEDRDEALVRAQIVDLMARIEGELRPDAADVDALEALWRSGAARAGGPSEGWKLVITALLQDPRMELY
ncbi:MAG: hypothetical protein H6738_22410 [Alphaproteobacteria bacterium]|nr:hypothetical protein [Alphaproteobacteria bacterium]